MTPGLPKYLNSWHCNSRIHCHRLPLQRKYAPDVKAAKDLSDAGRGLGWGVTIPPEPPSSLDATASIIIIHRFYIALFSALEQTHYACDSE